MDDESFNDWLKEKLPNWQASGNLNDEGKILMFNTYLCEMLFAIGYMKGKDSSIRR